MTQTNPDTSHDATALWKEEWLQNYLQRMSPTDRNEMEEYLQRASTAELAELKEHGYIEQLGADARVALESGSTKEAVRLSTEQLARNTDSSNWNYGNVIYEANQLLGRAALREGDTENAKRYLLLAGDTPGSPQLNSFGPEMILAQELLQAGEHQVIVDFLDRVTRFWATKPDHCAPEHAALYQRNANRITKWKQEIREGKQPNLNRCDFS